MTRRACPTPHNRFLPWRFYDDDASTAVENALLLMLRVDGFHRWSHLHSARPLKLLEGRHCLDCHDGSGDNNNKSAAHGTPLQTTEHILLECPKYQSSRHELASALATVEHDRNAHGRARVAIDEVMTLASLGGLLGVEQLPSDIVSERWLALVQDILNKY